MNVIIVGGGNVGYYLAERLSGTHYVVLIEKEPTVGEKIAGKMNVMVILGDGCDPETLKKAGIKVTMFVDAAASIALTKSQKTKKANLVLLGADAILKKGVINKVGSGMISQIAKAEKIPVYILTDSLKYSSKRTKIEQRAFEEVWKNPKIKIKNPAFELIKRKYITAIISEFGILPYRKFLKEARKSKI